MRSILLISLFFVAFDLAAQKDSISMSGYIDSVQIIGFLNYSDASASQNRRLDGQSLLKDLDRNQHFTVRSGGPGMLSTILRRGMASRHMGLLWNGFNIQNAANGTYDAGLIPHTFDNTKLYSHEVSTIVGNASIAGALDLDQEMGSESKTSLQSAYGSDQNNNSAITNTTKIYGYRHNVSVSYDRNLNKYDYFLANQKREQNRARIDVWNVNYKGSLQASDKLILNAGFWGQDAERIIPPSKTSVAILQEQKDENFRYSLGGVYSISNTSYLRVRTAYFDEFLGYESPGIDSRANTTTLNYAFDYRLNDHLDVSLQHRNDEIDANFYPVLRTRATSSITANFSHSFIGLRYNLAVRPQIVDKELTPTTFGFSLEREYIKNRTLRIQYNKGFTLPSFNDLYWPAGGDPLLNPEESNNFELTVENLINTYQGIHVELSAYANLITDWIQWTPIDGVFSPMNLQKVRNLGIDLSVVKQFVLGMNHSVDILSNYAFIDSRMVEHNIFSNLEGKKTIFIPTHKWSTIFQYQKGSWRGEVSTIFYSKRFDSFDNSTQVDGYFTADVHLTKRMKLKNTYALDASLSIENITNTDYEIIRFFPTPLRIFRLGLRFEIN